MCRKGWISGCRRSLWHLLPLMVFFYAWQSCFRWVWAEGVSATARAQTQTRIRMYFCFWKMRFLFFSPFSFISSCTLWMTSCYFSIPRRAVKESHRWLRVRCSGTESSDKRLFKVVLRFPSTPHVSGDSHLTPQYPNANWRRPGQAGCCFVRLGIGSENCKLWNRKLWKAAKKSNVFFFARLMQMFFTFILTFFVLVG